MVTLVVGSVRPVPVQPSKVKWARVGATRVMSLLSTE